MSDEVISDDPELRKALEEAFGADAFGLLSEMDAVDESQLQALCDEEGISELFFDNVAETTPETFLRFEVAGKPLAVPIESVIEIQDAPSMTPLSRGAEWFVGLANLRGSALPIIDLQRRLDLLDDSKSTRRRLIVVRSNQEQPLGLLVDSLTGLREMLHEQVPPDQRPLLTNAMDCGGQEVAVLQTNQLFE